MDRVKGKSLAPYCPHTNTSNFVPSKYRRLDFADMAVAARHCIMSPAIEPLLHRPLYTRFYHFFAVERLRFLRQHLCS